MRYLAISFALLISTQAIACDKDAEEVLRLIEGGNAEHIAKSVMHTESCEILILDGIASGQQRWINAALALYLHTDASYSEGIHDALGRAMLVAPSRVLPLVDSPNHQATHICLPWMMDDSGKSNGFYRRVVRGARSMFEEFAKTKYRTQARACLGVVTLVERNLGMTPTHPSTRTLRDKAAQRR
jgi:hypothetical protein